MEEGIYPCFVDCSKYIYISHLLNLLLASPGDIAFRFLQYIQSQSSTSQGANLPSEDFDIHMPREIEAQVYMDPAESQPDASSSSSSSSDEEDEGGRKRSVGDATSHVTVCDINQAMLDVGKQRAEEQGVTSGTVGSAPITV